jgi:hypothetical protein
LTASFRALLVGCWLAGMACGGAAASAGSDAGGDAPVGGPADFQTVLAFFQERCTICHDAHTMGLPHYPQLSLTAADAYAALVNVPADEACGGMRVVPGDPTASYLMKKLTEDPPCNGLHMPRAFSLVTPDPVTPAQLYSLRRWIAAGAKP